MTTERIIRSIRAQLAPKDSSMAAIKQWHSQEDVLEFLKISCSEDVSAHVSSRDLLVYSVILPWAQLEGDYIEKLEAWNFPIPSGYGYWYSGYGETLHYGISGPLENETPSFLKHSTPVFFSRLYYGRDGSPSYLELNQKISHVLDLHWTRSENSWCFFNDMGEYEPVVRYIQQAGLTCCTFRRRELDFYLFLAKSCLIRFFDNTRSNCRGMVLGRSERTQQTLKDGSAEIFGHRTLLHDEDGNTHTSFLRGFQIVRPQATEKELRAQLLGEEDREYASYFIFDWKNDRVIEWSSDPNELGNYFVESDLPLETSPAFFKPEVLDQYRANPSRYSFGDRVVDCRGGWSLQYDVNKEGQVHAYICDLSNLPYEVQLQWKGYNEKPKGTISARSFQTDFLGQWDTSYDPLRSLKNTLNTFPQEDGNGNPCPVWKMRALPKTRDLSYLGYVVTGSLKEWENQVDALAQIIVEGLNEAFIKDVARAKHCYDAEVKSGKQLARILETGDF